jgi:hypothetical protein
MARFPARENDITVLAEDLIAGLSEHTEFFQSPPVTTELLQASYQAYKEARDAAHLAARSGHTDHNPSTSAGPRPGRPATAAYGTAWCAHIGASYPARVSVLPGRRLTRSG